MSALPPKADIGTEPRDVRFVPKADIPLRQRAGAIHWWNAMPDRLACKAA
jgi:hypothetical protein